ncbi:MAG: CpaF family protein [Selenomonas sp.]|uniref:CpaF family protein n=1 Tax=Selenomonas sp. TaxID=2053611 RepID=UPI0025E6E15C|nr:CpaF family protein [Selenomonas sp.]MCR5757739.1 CpaF family protein [Selenomonas sp.]
MKSRSLLERLGINEAKGSLQERPASIGLEESKEGKTLQEGLHSAQSLLSASKGGPIKRETRVATAFAARQNETLQEDTLRQLKQQIHQLIVEEITPEEEKLLLQQDKGEIERAKNIISSYCQRILNNSNFTVTRGDRFQLIDDIYDELLGLGPLESLLQDDSVTEIMINGPQNVFVERQGKIMLSNVTFHDEAHLMGIIERILVPLGRHVDESSPLVDARLADGSRVNIIIPPLSLVGPTVTIRKFYRQRMEVADLIKAGTLNENMAAFLEACVKSRLNILVSGGTGSGKTTTLNVLSSFVPADERIITVEDAAELKLQQRHVVTLEARPANLEGRGAITIRDLVRNSLRMRPDRIIVGEVRGGESLDMLQAMNTGHDGSLTTAHANSPRDLLSRLETMVLMAGMELPVRSIRGQVASGIDLILQQSRMRDGSRKITYITEVQGMEGDTIVLQDLFRFEQDSIDDKGIVHGHFTSTGYQPQFMDKIRLAGIELPASMFDNGQRWEGLR